MEQISASYYGPLFPNSTKLAVALAVATSVLQLWRRLKCYLCNKKPFENLPMPPGSHFLVGHLAHFQQPFQEFFKIIVMDNCNAFGQTGKPHCMMEGCLLSSISLCFVSFTTYVLSFWTVIFILHWAARILDCQPAHVDRESLGRRSEGTTQ